MTVRTVICDFFSDWVQYIKRELSEAGYSVEPADDIEVVRKYLNLQKRIVEPKPRKVLKSEEFFCPPVLKDGLDKLERDISSGRDISPYMSRGLKSLDCSDRMLNHWGIHHMHLGETKESDGYVSRTNNLLFCRFDDEAAYFIGVYEHGAWAKQELVRILHRNWPYSIRDMRMDGVVGVRSAVSDAGVKKFRKSNVNPPIEMEDGTVYAALGGGVSMSGISTHVVMQEIQARKHLQDLENELKANIEEIAGMAENEGVKMPDKLHFELSFREDGIYAIETKTHVRVPLNR